MSWITTTAVGRSPGSAATAVVRENAHRSLPSLRR